MPPEAVALHSRRANVAATAARFELLSTCDFLESNFTIVGKLLISSLYLTRYKQCSQNTLFVFEDSDGFRHLEPIRLQVLLGLLHLHSAHVIHRARASESRRRP